MGIRSDMAITLSLAALMAMAPEPIWASEHTGRTGSTDVTVLPAGIGSIIDADEETDEAGTWTLGQTGASHLPTMLIAGGLLCGGAAAALRKRGHAAGEGDDTC